MEAPSPYSAFHLGLTAAGLLTAFLLARRLSRTQRPVKLLFICGLLLALSEVYKQLFRYYIVNGGHYDWWYFPFQLCSVPMYLCLLLPLLQTAWHGRIARAFYTFLQDYGLLGQYTHPEMEAAFAKVVAGAQASGKRAGGHFSGAAALKPWLDRGMTVNMWNSDLGMLKAGSAGMAELR